jgi:hypothetical protein
MVSLLEEYTTEEERSVVRFSFLSKGPNEEIIYK